MNREKVNQTKKWTAEEETLLRQVYVDRKITNKRMEEMFQRTIGAILSHAKRLELERKKWSKEHEALVVDVYDGSPESVERLAELTSRTKLAVEVRIRKLGLGEPVNYWTEVEDQILRENYLKLQEEDLLCLLPCRSWDSIISRAGKFKIGSRAAAGLLPRKWHWNFDYFEKIDTSEKAYWLGFIYADGSMSDRNIFRMGLVVEAEKHLHKFAAAVGYDGPITGPYFDKNYNENGKYTIALCHPKFGRDLQDKGVVPRKTWCVKFPHWLDKSLLPHFIRGLYDGDGSITRKTTKYKDKVYETASYSICGAVKPFLEDVVAVLVNQVGVSENKVLRPKETTESFKKGSTVWRFNYQGTPALRIRDWMYADATVWMECKKKKFYSYEYSSLRPQDKQHQMQIIDAEMQRRGWKRLSEYKGYYENMAIQCDKGHTWTTLVQNFKNECGCPRCCAIASGERMTEMGKENLTEIFAKRGWELLTEYVSHGEIRIKCEHGNVFTMKRISATRPHAQCDCMRHNSSYRCIEQLKKLLSDKGWRLVSEYVGSVEYVTIECQHGKLFKRLPINIKEKSKCDCDKIGGSGMKGVYRQKNGRWRATMFSGGGKQKAIGTYDTKDQAAVAREIYMHKLCVPQDFRT